VLEAYDAMTSERPYRPALTAEDACVELVAEAGGQFDPEIAHLLVEQIRRDQATSPEHVDETVLDALPHDLFGQLDSFAGPLTVTSTDGLTLLGNRRALEQDLADPGRAAQVTLLLIQLEDLARVNAETGYAAGDHMIQIAARNAQRAAARCGGRAYRASGRRLAILAPAASAGTADDPVVLVEAEFLAGPPIRCARCVAEPGDDVSAVLTRAREDLLRGGG
jgi:GGDEF domain-containing protein